MKKIKKDHAFKKKFNTISIKKILKKIWIFIGILIFSWTLIWFIYSISPKYISDTNAVVFFGIGFYLFMGYILITLITNIIKYIKKILKK